MTKWIGAAFGAAVMTCALAGGAQRAEAAPVTFTGSAMDTMSDLDLTLTLTFDRTNAAADYLSFTYGLDPASAIYDGKVYEVTDPNPSIVLTSFTDLGNYFYTATLQLRFLIGGTRYSDSVDISIDGLNPAFADLYFRGFHVAANVTGNPLSVVPLPASAPMFGAALIGLAGAATWRRRRA